MFYSCMTYQICSQLVAAWNRSRCPAPFPAPARVCITIMSSGNPDIPACGPDRSFLPMGIRAISRALETLKLTELEREFASKNIARRLEQMCV